jgi:ABC-2 type transport system ATP-binding protein
VATPAKKSTTRTAAAKPAKKPVKKPANKAAKKTATRPAATSAPDPAPVVDDPAEVVTPAPRAPQQLAIETNALSRTFKGGIEAVKGVDLAVERGEIFGFLGPNGAGKTTTVRMLCTLLPPTGGTAKVAGIDVTKDAAGIRRRIGVALQEIGLDPLQTGRELLELQCGLYGIPRKQVRSRADELLTLVGLTDAASRRIKTYSGGMKRRLDLASALVHSPEVLFLDEPTTGLDPASRITVWEEVRRINGTGTTVFLTTQYLEEADQLCDRLAIIDGGRIVAEGTPEELKGAMGHDVVSITLGKADPEKTRAVLAALRGVEKVVDSEGGLAIYVDNGAAAIPTLMRELDAQGIAVGSVSVSRPSLDDVFLQATGRRIEGADEQAEDDGANAKGGRR